MKDKIFESLRYKFRRIYYKYIRTLDKERIDELFEKIDPKLNYVALHNPNWLGVTSSTKALFKNTLAVEELYSKKVVDMLADKLENYKVVIFSGMVDGWENLMKELKNRNKKIKIKIVWHGGNALLSEKEDYKIFGKVLTLYKEDFIDQLVFVKKTMYECYKALGFNSYFLMNNFTLKDKKNYPNKKDNDKKLRLGLYSSGTRWVKNTFNQISAVSLYKDAIVDCVAYNDKIYDFAMHHGIKLEGSNKHMPQKELFKRMALNDVNVYATFTECAPMLPLESFELGVPCVTSNNHHYFKGTELEELTVVKEIDNIMAIKEKIDSCIKNRDKIMKLYKEWKKEYDKEFEKNVKEFLNQE